MTDSCCLAASTLPLGATTEDRKFHVTGVRLALRVGWRRFDLVSMSFPPRLAPPPGRGLARLRAPLPSPVRGRGDGESDTVFEPRGDERAASAAAALPRARAAPSVADEMSTAGFIARLALALERAVSTGAAAAVAAEALRFDSARRFAAKLLWLPPSSTHSLFSPCGSKRKSMGGVSRHVARGVGSHPAPPSVERLVLFARLERVAGTGSHGGPWLAVPRTPESGCT